MCDSVTASRQYPAELPEPAGLVVAENTWSLKARNKKVIQGWEELCQNTPANSRHCYEWLQAHPMQRKPRRCYQLKHKHYSDCWCYEIGAGERVYYKPRPDTRDVLIYYAGKHPREAPYPPKDI